MTVPCVQEEIEFISPRSELVELSAKIMISMPSKSNIWLRLCTKSQISAYATTSLEVELSREQALVLAEKIIKEMK